MTHLPRAYSGDLPYIFISYAHKNNDTVLPIIGELIGRGYRVWYDADIKPGSSWDAYISAKIKGSACVLAFMSEAYVKSDNCRNELKLARGERIPYVLIHIDGSEMTPGMELRYGMAQALDWDGTENDLFWEKLAGSRGMADAKEDRDK